MDKKRLKKLIRGKENQSRAEKSKGTKSESKQFVPGDIVVYNSIAKDPYNKDENDGRIFLYLGNAGSPELGSLGCSISGSFPDVKIVAVLKSDGDICYFLPHELSHSGDSNE